MLTGDDARWPTCGRCGRGRADFHRLLLRGGPAPSDERLVTHGAYEDEHVCLECADRAGMLGSGPTRARARAEALARRADPRSLSYRP